MAHALVSDEALIQRLPLPLAQLYRRAHNAKTPLDRHLSAFYLWEAALKLLGAAAVVAYADHPTPDPALAECLHNLARPALGHWWEFVRRLLPMLADAGDASFQKVRELVLGRSRDDLPHAAGLDAALRSALDGTPDRGRSTVRLTELLDRLVQYRNREIGHGAAGQRGGDFYDRMGRSLLAGAADLLGRLDVLAGRRLLYVAEVRRHASGAWLVERYELVGESARRIESLEIAAADTARLPHPERLYLEAAGGLRMLHPLALYDADAEEVLFLGARRGRSRAEYLGYTSGRTVERPDLGGEQRELLARALGVAAVHDDQVHQWESNSQAEEPAGDGAPPPSPQRQVGEFELLSELGRGGMGVVYRAWQPSLGRQVALKELLKPGDAKAESRFAREIRALGRVEHPHLVKIFTSGSDGQHWYYAMELVEGAPLSAVCERLQAKAGGAAQVDLKTWHEAVSTACTETRRAEKPLGAPPEGARPAAEPAAPVALAAGRSMVRHIADLMRQVAEALHALHEAGVVHRDVKPGNILVTADGSQAVLMDLGLAQLADESEGRLTRTRQFVGTLRYASPQQVLAVGRLDRRSDVYSLGATLWELLALRLLFGATELTPTPELMEKIQREEPGRLRRFHAGLPRDLEAIVQRCLEKDPSRRYATASELARDLRRFLDGEPVRARPVGGWERGWKWVRRHPTQAAAAGLLLAFVIALLVGGALSAYFAVEANDALGKVSERDKQLNQAKIQHLTEMNTQLDENNNQLEKMLARSLLRPLGQKKDEVADAEIEALWELAGSNERVRLLFVEQALQDPVTTRQLRNRADLAVHAAVGLDPALRQRVEEMLLSRLRVPKGDFDVRRDCALIARALGGWNQEFADAVARQALEAIGKTTDPDDLYDLWEAVAALAAQLGPQEASAAARQAMGETRSTNGMLPQWEAMAALAPRLESGDASAAVRQAMEAIAKSLNENDVRTLSEAVVALAPRLGPQEAFAAARQALESMGTARNDRALYALEEAVGALAPRLKSGDASVAVRQAVEALGTTTDDANAADALAWAVVALAPRLGAGDASAVARQVVESMGETTNPYGLLRQSEAMAALAPRMEAGDAARQASAAARQVVAAMGKTTDAHALHALAGAVAALAPWLEPGDALRSARQAVEVMGKVEDYPKGELAETVAALAAAVAALAPRMEAGDAARQASAAARQVVAAMGKTTDGLYARAVAALAPRMEPGDASAITRQVVEAMEKADEYDKRELAAAVAALAPRMEAGDAARQTSAAAAQVVEAMGKAKDTYKVDALADAMAALAPQMEPGDASAAARQAVKAMGKADDLTKRDLAAAVAALAPQMEPGDAARQTSAAARQVVEAMRTTTDAHALYFQAGAVAALAPWLEPSDALRTARQVVEAMGKTPNADALRALADAVAALIVKAEPEDTSLRINSLALAIGNSAAPPALFAGLAPLAEASRPMPGRFTEQQLVDLLKMPTCQQPARQVIVRQLGWQCGRSFADMWDFVEWAKVNRPDLDLTSPPVRPSTLGN